MPITRRATKCLVPGAAAVYLCNEGTGQVLHDYSGNGNDGTLGPTGNIDTADPTWAQYGLEFAGAAYAKFPNLAALASGGPYTVQAAVRFDDVDNGTHRCIWGLISSTSGTGGTGCLLRKQGTTGRLQFLQYNSDGAKTLKSAYPEMAMSPDEWLVLTAVYDGSAISLYIGDTLGATTATGYTPDPTGAFFVGRYPYVVDAYHLGGVNAALAYPFALTPGQVAQNNRAIRAVATPRGIDINL